MTKSLMKGHWFIPFIFLFGLSYFKAGAQSNDRNFGCAGFMISSLIPENASCQGTDDGRIAISLTGGLEPYSYSVDGGANFQSFAGDSVLISGLAMGEYDIVVLDSDNCQLTYFMNPVIISEPDSLIVDIEILEKGCFNSSDGVLGASATGGTSPYSFHWSFGATSSSISGLSPSVYSITVTDSESCVATHVLLYENYPLIQVNAGPDQNIQSGETALISATTDAPEPYSVQWSPSESLSDPFSLITEANPTGDTQYVITVTTPEGCFGLSAMTVNVDYGDGGLVVPNAFTPNDDGNNDTFRPLFTGPADLQRLTIFNRWGQEVYQSSSNLGWDGTFLGADQPGGTYVYHILFTDNQGNKKELTGGFHLIR